MKKGKGAVRALLLLAGLAAALLLGGRFYGRVPSPRDGISGTIRLTVDGEPRRLERGDISAFFGAGLKEQRLRLRQQEDGRTRVALRAGSYGEYWLDLRLEGVERPLSLYIFQPNWWNRREFWLDIAVDRAAGTVRIACTATTLSNERLPLTYSKEGTLALDGETLTFSLS